MIFWIGFFDYYVYGIKWDNGIYDNFVLRVFFLVKGFGNEVGFIIGVGNG